MKARLMTFSKALPIALVLLAPTFLPTVDSAAYAQGRGGQQTAVVQQPTPVRAPGELELLPVQGNVYLLAGAGANITVQVDEAGVVLVDTGNAASSDKVLAAVGRLSTKPIRYIINTQFHDDHNGGNEAIAKASRNPPVIAFENVLNRMSAPVGSISPRRTAEWPTDTFFSALKDLYNGEVIQIFHQSAQTDGDSFVHFRKSDVISAGDILMTTTYPIIDLQAKGNINGIIEGLNRILDIAVPIDKQENGTLVVPGHGRICDEADVVEYRDMVTIVRDRIQDAVKRGLTLEQVKTAKLTLDHDGRYGATTGPWTTDMFIDAVYKNLSTSTTTGRSSAPSASSNKNKK